MSINITGKIERQGFGFGIWALVTEAGQTYELKDAPSELTQIQGKVKIIGQIREDVMTLAMIGPVLEVQAYEKISEN